jgi:hypothetical protein
VFCHHQQLLSTELVKELEGFIVVFDNHPTLVLLGINTWFLLYKALA